MKGASRASAALVVGLFGLPTAVSCGEGAEPAADPVDGSDLACEDLRCSDPIELEASPVYVETALDAVDRWAMKLEDRCRRVIVATGGSSEPNVSDPALQRARDVCASAAMALPEGDVVLQGSFEVVVYTPVALVETYLGGCGCDCAIDAPVCPDPPRGRCAGTCVGRCVAEVGEGVGCAGRCDGVCLGECSSTPDPAGRCEGTCTGRCDGACTVDADDLICDGICDGTCSTAVSAAGCGEPQLSHEDRGCRACWLPFAGLAKLQSERFLIGERPFGTPFRPEVRDVVAMCSAIADAKDLPDVISGRGGFAHNGGYDVCSTELLELEATFDDVLLAMVEACGPFYQREEGR